MELSLLFTILGDINLIYRQYIIRHHDTCCRSCIIDNVINWFIGFPTLWLVDSSHKSHSNSLKEEFHGEQGFLEENTRESTMGGFGVTHAWCWTFIILVRYLLSLLSQEFVADIKSIAIANNIILILSILIKFQSWLRITNNETIPRQLYLLSLV